jgi:hypothetical protein
MFSVVKSFSAAERLNLASQFVRSFPAGTEFLLIGASRDAVDDFVRGLACSAAATFGLHRFSLTQFAARRKAGGDGYNIAIRKLLADHQRLGWGSFQPRLRVTEG